jgi:flagellar basal-body rod protein FlgG
MIKGLYTSASGMNAELLRQDVVANNLANVSTAGFKKEDASFEAFGDKLLQRINDRMDAQTGGAGAAMAANVFGGRSTTLGVAGSGVRPAETTTHFSDGALVRTDRPLDIGLQGNALFTVERGDGSLAYTRAGSFTLNSDHELVTMAGDKVMGTSGQPIKIDGGEVVVDETGGIKVDGVEADRFALVAWDKDRFSRLGENLYLARPAALEGVGEEQPVNVRVAQGFNEAANVNTVEEMVRMIGVMRAYEANQKSIQMQDDSLNQLINQVGKV